MEVWQFWLGIGVIFALLGLIIAILVRKHKDKHRYIALQTNLTNLERSFEFLSEEMEIVTNRNLKTMEEKCESMRELLVVADKKCLYADNLLKGIDQSAELLKQRSLSAMPSVVAPSQYDEKIAEFIKETQNAFNDITRRLGYLNKRIEALEAFSSLEQQEDENRLIGSENLKSEFNNSLMELKKEIADIKQNISMAVTNEVSKQLSVLDNAFAEIADTAISIDASESDIIAVDESIPAGNVTDIFHKRNIDDIEGAKTHLVNREFYPKGKELVVKEIMELYEQGITVPQIASELEMSRGEINLIIKMNTSRQSHEYIQSGAL